MKKAIIVLLLLPGFYSSMAQDERDPKEEKEGGFKKENLFTGGGLNVSFSNYSMLLGASPVFGYSINKWLDAGVGLNFSYYTNRHVVYEILDFNGRPTGQYIVSDDKQRQTTLGPLVFVRVYPVKFLFIHVQGEQNFITQKLIFDNGNPSSKASISAPSLLLGAGYASGREGIGDFSYYISLMFDVVRNKNSPYVEETASGNINVLPIIRAGIQIPLFQGRRKR